MGTLLNKKKKKKNRLSFMCLGFYQKGEDFIPPYFSLKELTEFNRIICLLGNSEAPNLHLHKKKCFLHDNVQLVIINILPVVDSSLKCLIL